MQGIKLWLTLQPWYLHFMIIISFLYPMQGGSFISKSGINYSYEKTQQNPA